MSQETIPQAPPQHEFSLDQAQWSYTTNADEVARLRQQAEQRAGRAVRHTIGRDVSVLEGVYEGKYGGEAIVVDYDKDPVLIDGAVNEVLARATDTATGRVNKSQILDSVFEVVSDKMRYDSATVDQIFEQGLGGRNGSKISLSAYIERGVGECRHQALFATTILQLLSKRGVVGGQASIDRNMVRSGADGKYDGHAWTRYTNSAGEVFIIDVAQKKIGSLSELMAEHAKDPSKTWDYARPEDKRKGAGHIVTSALEAKHTSGKESFTNEQGIIDRVPWDLDSKATKSENHMGSSAGSEQGNARQTVAERMAELTRGLNDKDKRLLEYYASALEDKQQAQKEGDGDGSTYWGQVAGQHYRELSENARNLASQYAHIHKAR